MASYDYDLLVVGSGPAGQRAAIQAAKLGKRVAVVERKTVVGGVCVNTGAVPSKSLREAVLYLSGARQKGFYGASYAVKDRIDVDDLTMRTDHAVRNEIEVIRDQLHRNGVQLISAGASFVGPHEMNLDMVDGGAQRRVTADRIVIATGAREPDPKTFPPSRFDSSPCVRWLPRRFSTWTEVNSSAKQARMPMSPDEVKLADESSGPTPVTPTPSTLPLLEDAGTTGFQNQLDAPPCAECGSIMVRSGSCFRCYNCGATSGCS